VKVILSVSAFHNFRLVQGRIQPVSLGGCFSVKFGSQVSLRVHYCTRGEAYFTTLLWQNNRRQNGLIDVCLSSHDTGHHAIAITADVQISVRGIPPGPFKRHCTLLSNTYSVYSVLSSTWFDWLPASLAH